MTPLLISVAVKGLLVLAVAFGLLAVLRGAPPALRHGIWTAAFAALLVLPVLDAFAPAWTVPILPTAASGSVTGTTGDIGHTGAIGLIGEMDPIHELGLIGEIEHIDETVIVCDDAFECAPVAAISASSRTSGGAPSGVAQHAPHVISDMHETETVTQSTSHAWSNLTLGGIGLWLLAIWALGTLAVLVRWAAAYAAAAFVVRGAVPVTDDGWLDGAERARRLLGLDAEVRVLVSERLSVPVAWGWGTPAVVLPPDAEDWDEDRRDAVLLHELAHVRRGDARTGLVAHLALALHWPNPLAWLAYRRFLVEREHACDDAVLSGGATPSAYAGHLVDIARGAGGEPRALAALAPMARASDLEGRVLAVLDAGRRRVAAGRSSLVRAVAFGLVVAAPLGVLHPVAAEVRADSVVWLDDADAFEPVTEDLLEPMDATGLAAEVLDDMVDVADVADPEDAVEALRDTIPLARDVLGPARETTLATVRRMRADGLGLDDDAWDEIEREVEDAFDEAHADYDGIVSSAIQQALADENGTRYSVSGWQSSSAQSRQSSERQAALRDAAESRREAAERRHEAGEERREALRHASRDRERAQRQASRDRDHALRDAERARRAALRDGERAREEALREAARVRERGLRQADRTRRQTARSRSGSGYAYSTGPDGVTVSFSGTPGVGPWMEQLDDLDRAIGDIERAAAELSERGKVAPGVMAGLHGGLAGIEGAVEGIAVANAWARSDAERRIARTRLDATRSRLRAARQHIDACESAQVCEDD